MNIIKKQIILKEKAGRPADSSQELLNLQLNKIDEIEKCNNVIMPLFVKDAIIDVFFTEKQKKAFLDAEKLRDKAANWLFQNNVISVAYVFANRRPAIYKINNMPKEWLCYADFKRDMSEQFAKILAETFKEGMAIFD